jgi:putative Holliday junction resolvase
MRILGIDFGDRNIGLALSDPLELTAQPLGHYQLADADANAAFFKELVRKHEVGEIVVGNPLRMDGSIGTRSQKTSEFAAWLEKAAGIPVKFWDERLTTQQAMGIMEEQKIRYKAKKRVEHQISATLILQSYLDHRRFQKHVHQDS